MGTGDSDVENDDDDDTNESWKDKAKASRAAAGDGKAAAGRSLAARENAAKVRQQLADNVRNGSVQPTPEAPYNRVGQDPVTGELYEVDSNGRRIVSHYTRPPPPATTGGTIDAATFSPQAQIATNNAEAGTVSAEATELNRSQTRSRAAEVAEADDADAAGDKKRADEARTRRNRMIAGLLGTAGLAAILVPTLLKVTGHLDPTPGGGGGNGGSGGGGVPPTGPKVQQEVRKSGLDPSKAQTVDVPAEILAAPDPTVDPASVVLTASDSDDTGRLTVFQAGLFRLDPAKGALTFYPLTHFVGGKVEAKVTIANKSNQRSGPSKITLDFDKRVVAGDLFIQADLTQVNTVTFNPLTGKGVTMGMAAAKGTHDIDATTVFLKMPVPMEGGEPQQGTMTNTGGRQAVMDKEGTWTVDSTTGDIAFARNPAFRGSPTPIAWIVYDKQMIPSTLGTATITAFLDPLVKAVQGLNGMDDASFWSHYQASLLKADWGALAAKSEIVGKLTLFRTVHQVIQNITRDSLSDADFVKTGQALPAPAVLTGAFTNWAKAGFGTDVLYTEAVRITPASSPVDSITNGARMVRLRIISRLLGLWQDALDKMPSPGGGT